jgi:hypothetical protein
MKRSTVAWSLALVVLVLGLGAAALVLVARPPGAPPATSEARDARQREPYEIAEAILQGRLVNGWEDFGWGPHDAAGERGIRVNFSGYGGIVFRHERISTQFGALVFQIRAPPGYDEFLQVSLQNPELGMVAFPTVEVRREHVALLDDGAQEVLLPWDELNPNAQPFDRIVLKARRNVAGDWVTVDRVALTKATGNRRTASPTRRVRLAVRCDKPALAINPLIYGIAAGVWSTGETGHRIGGNPMSRHNWELKTWNTGSDWYFRNVKSDTGLDDWLNEASERKVKMALQVPMLGWVAKDGSSVSFPRSRYGKQQKQDPHHSEAGNGLDPDGKPLTSPPPTQTSVAAPPELIKKWITNIRAADEQRGVRRVHVYILDNEPNLWNSTHRDVHPDPLTYDELLERTIRYGTAIRDADTEAVIAGPAEWGWSGYFFSARDTAAGALLRPDRRLHGDVPLLPWYLQQLAAHERRTGKRILDLVDVHFYPQAEGVHSDRSDPETSALRLRSTRAFWDPNYLDESWINDRVNLIPRVRDWIADNYPGRGIAIGEWSFGGEKHISGALAIAEVLGRFGQQGVTAAFYWRVIEAETPAYYAFRAFRNYDGQGGRFLDLSVPTEESSDVSLFASRDEARSRLVLVALNLNPASRADANLALTGCGEVVSRRVFAYESGSKALAALPAPSGAADAPSPGAIGLLLPPYSLSIVELDLGRPAP